MTTWPRYSSSPNVERPLATEIIGPPRDEELHGRFVAAICPRCGGWTMMHGDPTGTTGKEWMRRCYVIGELIVYWRNPVSLGPHCPDVENLPDERTCDREPSIADLIDRSSIGAAMRDIAERGIDAHAEDMAREMAPRRGRKRRR